jgi:peptidoglycan hydrolase-like protein with peptidoglycan-binding domain
MKLYKNLFVSLISLVAVFSIGQLAHAQTVNPGGPMIPASPICYNIPNSIRYGANDIATNSEVTDLQNFLVTQGLFDASNIGSGHFGPITLAAVLKFQAMHGIPATGFVGTLTRASIENLSCGSTTPPITTTSPVTLYSINPTSGATGSTINITGFGFTGSNTILFNGNVAAQNIPITSSIAIACTTSSSCHGGINQTITTSVPTALSPNCPAGSACPMYALLVTPGQYSVTVQNTNGTSNAIPFTVTANSGTIQPLSINAVDAPSSLGLGQTGTWTVHVVAPSNAGNLHYSVQWGDGAQALNAIMAPTTSNVQASNTFTHAYQKSGTYTATFTVTDDAGSTTSSSNTITVSPLYY